MMTEVLLFFGGFVTGMLSLIGYGCYRGVNAAGWDDSNALNWIRLFSHIILHPGDFTKMYYLSDEQLRIYMETYQMKPESPFPYLGKDEFSENFPSSRP